MQYTCPLLPGSERRLPWLWAAPSACYGRACDGVSQHHTTGVERILTNGNHQQKNGKPVWGRLEQEGKQNQGQCRQDNHIWTAFFYESGRLAFWECADCGEKDREIGRAPERLDRISGWILSPPRLIARGPRPQASMREWATRDGGILKEGDPSSIHFIGEYIPGLKEAHAYVKCDRKGKIEEAFEPVRKQLYAYTDHYWLIRYQVIGTELVRFESPCFEDSTYEVPNAGEPRRIAFLSGLRLLANEGGEVQED
jgi:hypothetical protein